jgi:hypothetical protein
MSKKDKNYFLENFKYKGSAAFCPEPSNSSEKPRAIQNK